MALARGGVDSVEGAAMCSGLQRGPLGGDGLNKG
jgi:hypothetical protein